MEATAPIRVRPYDGRVSLTVSEAAVAVGCSRTAIYALLRAGDLPSFTIGARRFIALPELERLVARRSGPIPRKVSEQKARAARAGHAAVRGGRAA